MPFLSIVIPLYNEEARLEGPLKRVADYLATREYSLEIVLVDDGSTDQGLALGTAILAPLQCRPVRSSQNRGKGHALRLGMAETRGRYVMFTDVDLSTPIEALENMIPFLTEGYPIVQGSRNLPGAEVTVHQSWVRERLGEGFTWLSNLILPMQATDVTCGFKCYDGRVAREVLFPRMRMNGWTFDAELLYIARRHGCAVKEVPVLWHHVAGSKVRVVRDSFRCLRDLLRIRLNGWLGRYN